MWPWQVRKGMGAYRWAVTDQQWCLPLWRLQVHAQPVAIGTATGIHKPAEADFDRLNAIARVDIPWSSTAVRAHLTRTSEPSN